MQTSVIGYPRIGKLRELKFTLEKYFRKEIGDKEVLDTGKKLRELHWNTQKEAVVDYISSNDFSYYDTLLDTAMMFNIIPKRYKELKLSELDTYFAMARGYQGNTGDVKALAMKKWFNTNYHYIVPEIEDETDIRLTGNKLFDEYEQAKELGIETKSVIAGPYTLLKLCRYTGKKAAADFAGEFVEAYKELVVKCKDKGIEWIQFDEPALVLDMSDEDKRLFLTIYDELFIVSDKVRILLQTYFGDVRDIYEDIIKMPFSGIGLDFIEGRQSFALIEEYGFPKDKLLFAGLVNGKNIWKNNYAKTLNILEQLKGKGIDTVLSTSCSLLHVPYTLENEEKLSEKYTAHFAFAKEKLAELNELSILADNEEYRESSVFKKNQKLFFGKRDCENIRVQERVEKITEKDYIRLPKRAERLECQKNVFRLPVLPTTTIGSFPQTSDVKSNRQAYRKGTISNEEYVEFNRRKIAECVAFQEETGIDVLVHEMIVELGTGEDKRVYQITEEGRELLCEEQQRLKKQWQNGERILGEGV